MSSTLSYVVARWSRPLTDLQVNTRLENELAPPDLTPLRVDGWQRLIPGGYYDGELLPPVDAIEGEVGGPVLGMGVESSAHWRLLFREGGELRFVAAGPSEDGPETRWSSEMVERWGQDWRTAAAESLFRWAEAIGAKPTLVGIHGLLSVNHLFKEHLLSDLLVLLGLGARDEEEPWWSTQVPNAAYAIEVLDISVLDLHPPGRSGTPRDLALAFIPHGAGIWSLATGSWVFGPTNNLGAVLNELPRQLVSRGWHIISLPF